MSNKSRILIILMVLTLPIMMSLNNKYVGGTGGAIVPITLCQPKISDDFLKIENQVAHKTYFDIGTREKNLYRFNISSESGRFYIPENGWIYSFDEKVTTQEKSVTVYIEVVPEMMKFDKDVFTVPSGKKIVLEIDNRDGMQHNLLIVKPGSLQKVGAAADAMLRDPKASEKQYVPQIPEVLFSTKMLEPNEVFTLTFTAPSQPGDYPFVCTFPGHWRMMNGIMRVVKP